MRKSCLIIGASGGIGIAVTRALIEEGYRVGLQYFSNDGIIKTLEEEVPEEQWGQAVKADLSSSEGIRQFLTDIEDGWDSLVFCGGHLWNGFFQDMSEKDMDELFHVHVKAPWMITKHILPSMISKKKGNIVVVSSIFGEEGASLEVAYSSVKGAQISFVKGLAKEVAPSGIRVNAVTPGLIQTKMNQRLSREEWVALEEDIPLGRAGTPEEIAHAISYLLSEQSTYVTGHIMKVNGGWS